MGSNGGDGRTPVLIAAHRARSTVDYCLIRHVSYGDMSRSRSEKSLIHSPRAARDLASCNPVREVVRGVGGEGEVG